MAGQARTYKVRNTRTGVAYWIERRAGFRGIEWNYGGGWRPTRLAAREAAVKSGGLNVCADQS